MERLDQKVALVTGGARGIGQAICFLLARAGCHIAIFDICRDLPYPNYPLASRAELERTVFEINETGVESIGVEGDIRSEADVVGGVETVLARFGQIDFLVNNAAIAGMKPFWEIETEEWDTLNAINLRGPWLMSKYVVPHMIRRREGKIVNVSSASGTKGMALLGHYVASKQGLNGLTRTMAAELAPYNINVNTVLPGTVPTVMLDGMAAELGITQEDIYSHSSGNQLFDTLIDPISVAETILWLLSDRGSYITGASIPVEGGWLVK